jgi:hypothetical protein
VAVSDKVAAELQAFIDRIRGFADDAERSLKSAKTDEDAVSAMIHDTLSGMANASTSIGNALFSMRWERQKKEHEEEKGE